MIFSHFFFSYRDVVISTQLLRTCAYVLVTGRLDNREQAFLVVDRKIVTELQNFLDVPFSLMSAFCLIYSNL